MKRRHIIYISLISIFLLVFLGVQYFWISTSIDLSKSNFHNSTNSILKKTISEFEESFYCVSFYSEFETDGNNIISIHNKNKDSLVTDTASMYFYDIFNADSLVYTNILDLSLPAKIQIELNTQFLFHEADSIDATDYLKNNIGYYFNDTSSFNTYLFDSILSENLKAEGLNLEYCFAISYEDSICYISNQYFADRLLDSNVHSTLTVKGVKSKAYKAYLYFPNEDKTILNKLIALIVTTIGIFALLSIVLVFFFRNINNDRKLHKMKSGFISNMTHEFKTPVSNINLALDTIEKKNNYNKSDSIFLDIIREENLRMKNNVEKILLMSVMEDSNMTFAKEEVQMNDLIDNLLDCFKIELQEKGGSISFQKEKDISKILIDKIHLINVIFNIIDNAIKYSSASRKTDIQIITRKNNKSIFLEISDNGIGIKESDQKRIFDKFFRVQHDYIHDIKGFGLGLSYVQTVIDGHNGQIKVSSELGKGSRFIIQLPIG